MLALQLISGPKRTQQEGKLYCKLGRAHGVPGLQFSARCWCARGLQRSVPLHGRVHDAKHAGHAGRKHAGHLHARCDACCEHDASWEQLGPRPGKVVRTR